MSERPSKWRDLLREPDLTAAKTILLCFVIICSLQVFLRFILPVPLSWTEELVSAFVIWMTFLGIIAVERKGTHIRVELIDEVLPPKAVARNSLPAHARTRHSIERAHSGGAACLHTACFFCCSERRAAVPRGLVMRTKPA